RQLAREGLRQADLGGLGQVVAGTSAALAPIDRRDENDSAVSALAHQRDRRTGRAQAAEYVELEDLFEIAVGRLEAGAPTATGVVDQAAQPAELTGGGADEGLNLAGHRDIGRLRENA